MSNLRCGGSLAAPSSENTVENSSYLLGIEAELIWMTTGDKRQLLEQYGDENDILQLSQWINWLWIFSQDMPSTKLLFPILTTQQSMVSPWSRILRENITNSVTWPESTSQLSMTHNLLGVVCFFGQRQKSSTICGEMKQDVALLSMSALPEKGLERNRLDSKSTNN
jgi:hypothetical protein